MMRDITIGQFFPGNSILHRLDPRTKLLATLLYISAVFCARSIGAFIVLAAFTAGLVAVSGISPKVIVRGMKPVLFIIIFTAFINLFWTKGDTVLVEFWVIRISLESILYALMIIMRIICLLCGTCLLLSYTTSPIALTDGLERILSPLAVLHVPVHEFSLMMSTALRLIPTLIEETDKIMNAQKSRGADFSTGGPIKRARALLPVIIPLFISALQRAEELATAMECRCYRGGNGRTRMTVRRFTALDLGATVTFCLLIAAAVLVNRFVPIFNM